MIIRIEPGDSRYPAILQDRLGGEAPSCLYLMGDASILRQPLLALICSIQCPGSIVIETLDAIRMLRDRGAAFCGIYRPVRPSPGPPAGNRAIHWAFLR